MLVMTSSGNRLEAGAAASYELMNDEFRAEFGKDLDINSGARPDDDQEVIFRRHYTTIPINGRPRRWWNGAWWYQRPGFATVAVPGTSVHRTGLAADFGSGAGTYGTPEHNWMRANAWRWGWVWPLWAQGRLSEASPINPRSSQFEAWHWEKRGPVLAGDDSTPFNPQPSKNGNDVFDKDAKDHLDRLADVIIQRVREGASAFSAEDRDLLQRAAAASESAKAGVWNGGADIIDGVAQRFNYGALPISAYTQQLVAKQAGQLAAIAQVVEQLAAGNGTILDFPAIELAAERGAREALSGLVLRAE